MTQILETPDSIRWTPVATISKYGLDIVETLTRRFGHEPTGADLAMLARTEGLKPDETIVVVGNQLTDAGRNRICNLIIGTASTPAFNASQSIVGVGSSTTAFAGSQTAMGGDGSTTTAYYQGTDSGATPTQTGGTGTISASATFQTGNANFHWNEWGWIIGTGTITPGGTLASVATSPLLLNRKVQDLGTKASGTIWTLAATITIS